LKRLGADLSCLGARGRGGSGPFCQQPSSESRLLSASRSRAGESTHEAQQLGCTDFTKWGYYLNQIRDAKKLERQVQQMEEATRPERERGNSRGSNAGRNVSSHLFVKRPPPAAAGCCFLKGLFSLPAPLSSPAEQEQGLEADFQCCRQIPSFGITITWWWWSIQQPFLLHIQLLREPGKSPPCTSHPRALCWRGTNCEQLEIVPASSL